MFAVSSFTGDISKWDVSAVNDMSWMFYRSSFTGDISKWDVSAVNDMSRMFYVSSFKCLPVSSCAIQILLPNQHLRQPHLPHSCARVALNELRSHLWGPMYEKFRQFPTLHRDDRRSGTLIFSFLQAVRIDVSARPGSRSRCPCEATRRPLGRASRHKLMLNLHPCIRPRRVCLSLLGLAGLAYLQRKQLPSHLISRWCAESTPLEGGLRVVRVT
eukprot:2453985-Rhodomonas_salina.1